MLRFIPLVCTPRAATVLCSLLLSSFAWGAPPLQPGDDLPPMALRDQHDRSLALHRDTRLIFFAAEMSASRVMAKALEGLPSSALQDRRALYIADISSMPQPISTIVAMPRMQKLPYAVAVIRYAGDGAHLPRKAGAVTVLTATQGRISDVSFVDRPEQVSAYLAGPARAPAGAAPRP